MTNPVPQHRYYVGMVMTRQLYLPDLSSFATTWPSWPGSHSTASPEGPRKIFPVSSSTLTSLTGYKEGKIIDTNPQEPGVLSIFTREAFPSVEP